VSTITYTGSLQTCSCWCGIQLAVPTTLYEHAKDDDKNHIYCPLGHTFVFRDNNRVALEAERRRHRATRELLHAEERSHVATRGHLTRQKKRIAAGVCPCCHRTFKQLARHMKAKHPDYSQEVTK
jgi:hypothetical protein